MILTPSELIEISLINCFPKDFQTSTLKGLLSQCDSKYSSNPNYSRKKLEALPTATAIYLTKQLLENTHAPTT